VRLQRPTNSRIEVQAAYLIGVLLPTLETLRRGLRHWAVDATTMFEDYFAGALLLVAAALSSRKTLSTDALTVLAWAYVTGMMSSSFWGQLEDTLRGTVQEPPIVLGFKVFLWGTCVVSLTAAFLRLEARQSVE
jgi:hypothetical protein